MYARRPFQTTSDCTNVFTPHIVLAHSICPCNAGYFEVMFTQQVANYDQDLGVTTTGPMQMNWLLRSQAYAWYFLPPVTSVLILWW